MNEVRLISTPCKIRFYNQISNLVEIVWINSLIKLEYTLGQTEGYVKKRIQKDCATVTAKCLTKYTYEVDVAFTKIENQPVFREIPREEVCGFTFYK